VPVTIGWLAGDDRRPIFRDRSRRNPSRAVAAGPEL